MVQKILCGSRGIFSYPTQLVKKVVKTLDEFKNASVRSKESREGGNNTVQKWKAPIAEFVKVNWDATVDRNNRIRYWCNC